MTRIRIAADAPCDECPFAYDTITCKANEARQERDEEGAPVAPILPTSVSYHASGAHCDVFVERPDWCPLNAGAVTVELVGSSCSDCPAPAECGQSGCKGPDAEECP